MSNRVGKKTRQHLSFGGGSDTEVQCHLAFHVLSCYHVLSFMYGSAEQDLMGSLSTPIWNTGNSSQPIPPLSDFKLLLLLL